MVSQHGQRRGRDGRRAGYLGERDVWVEKDPEGLGLDGVVGVSKRGWERKKKGASAHDSFCTVS